MREPELRTMPEKSHHDSYSLPPEVEKLQGEFSRELKAAYLAALEAGEILARHWTDRGFTVDEKSRGNPVTTADFEADHKLKEILHGGFPDYGWLSEETADDGERLKRDRVWIVDPLDGTKEFIKGVPEFVVAIALADRGVPVLGVTYNPIKHEMFWGGRGFGCYLDGAPVHVTSTTRLADAIVLASRSETARGEWKAFDDVVKTRAIGSVAYKLALVAAGQADATFTMKPKSEWDIASGVALLIVAGGRVNNIDGSDLRFNQPSVKLKGFVASNTLLHEELQLLIPRT
jgi:myo-inositol-1(or 4)-monophosphatase